MSEDWRHGGFGLYVHWPFCAAKCPYCDFNSHVVQRVDHAAWRGAFLNEIERYAAETPGRVLHSIFFGGGTPSLMEAETVGAVIEAAGQHWTFANDLEVTLEANPGSVEAGRFAAYRDAGVNRVSMGIQALNDQDLRRLGRIHTVAEALAAFDIARNCFDRVSFDLIYARQGQTIDQWRSELTEALNIAIDHISLYQLTIEEGTAFGDRYERGKLRGLPNDDLAADMYDATQEICAGHGMERYEVSNHARPGSESRHNKIYWNYGDYVGIGPGAHGRITVMGQKFATEAPRSPPAWLNAAGSGRGENLRSLLTGQQQAEESLMMGLRLVEGFDTNRFKALSGKALSVEAIGELEELGMIKRAGSRIIATERGFSVLNAVIAELLAD